MEDASTLGVFLGVVGWRRQTSGVARRKIIETVRSAYRLKLNNVETSPMDNTDVVYAFSLILLRFFLDAAMHRYKSVSVSPCHVSKIVETCDLK